MRQAGITANRLDPVELLTVTFCKRKYPEATLIWIDSKVKLGFKNSQNHVKNFLKKKTSG
jgi:CRISPR/Cas system CMR-associated protein Cmr5 small subunit